MKKEIKKEIAKSQDVQDISSSKYQSMFHQPATAPKIFAKTMWVTQAKQLLRLFSVNLTNMTNALIKINDDFLVDFTFIDKVLQNMVGLHKKDLLEALMISDTP